MRPIEFRVWHKPTQQMHFVNSIDFEQQEIIPQLSEDATEDEWDHVNDNPLKFEDCELMQFTGILDENGAKIWEGDILLYDEDEYMPVIFLNGAFGWPGDKYDGPVEPLCVASSVKDEGNHDTIVVGNIYQDGPLLEPDPVLHEMLKLKD